MKIAILSDIHGNVPALEAVLEDIQANPPDLCVLNGDVINRGPDSLGVIRLLQQHLPDAIRIKGNHEAWVLRCRDEDVQRSGAEFETQRFAYWTLDQLGREMDSIEKWHDDLDLPVDGGGLIHFTHGSRKGNRDGIHPRLSDAELSEKLGEKRDLFIASHTHIPMVREFNETLVVNSGSIGSPFDLNPRASYARVSLRNAGWHAEIVRLKYDQSRTEKIYETSGFLEQAGPLARLMLRELQISRGLMGPWNRQWRQSVVEGEISLLESVEKILAETTEKTCPV